MRDKIGFIDGYKNTMREMLNPEILGGVAALVTITAVGIAVCLFILFFVIIPTLKGAP